ncbi:MULTISPECIES: HD domain-containing phosphohydrolase [Nitrosomonas]|uniref:HD domain-containing protein n=1 Tax=Nitrosomonas communis TaxID=44574 RepID=A0A0F7KGB0_9PROT|nr:MULTISPECIES: HD domain-containing phosphohydrolase [Nitrosomonas]AKH38491.1 phosphohydrolase [Nitrosomonas communis]TYP84686.1 HD domain-containing protein [Nitrosomonas communis]UVS60530.1 HD domain-containing protein [Nitrosomonas sp. PLL12]SDW36657.1 HD domain-containing protein [Nitrosomonas communis]
MQQQKDLFTHQDTLANLHENIPLTEKLRFLHQIIRQDFPFLDRFAIALFDEKTQILKTYTHSTEENDSPVTMYEAPLSSAPSLHAIIEHRRPRLVQDLNIFSQGTHEHTRRIAAKGYKSSYTMPLYQSRTFIGFLFFNSLQEHPFTPQSLRQIDIYGHLIALMVINELTAIRTLIAAVRAARSMTHYRDLETGSHIDRTAHYARLIAHELASKYNYDITDEQIEHIFLFSPMHDVGKIGIPDNILRKPGRLDDSEFDVMKTHPGKGREIVDAVLKDFSLGTFGHVDILRNIAEYHHEAIDGSGYPKGLKGDEIPIEARISAVADVFDALTSRRVYKAAWTNDEAFAVLQKMSNAKLDRDCVNALINNLDKILVIQRQFRDEDLI